MTATLKRRAPWLAKVAGGLLLFWIAFRDVDVKAVQRSFILVDWRWLVAAVASVFLTLHAATARWALLLTQAPFGPVSPVLFHAIVASQAANIVMPFKLGDAFRIGAVSRALAVPPAEVLASVAVERAYDTLALGVACALLVSFGVLPQVAQTGLASLTLVIAAGAAFGLSAWRWPGVWRRLGTAAGSVLPERPRQWLAGQGALLVRGFARAAKARLIAGAAVLSAAVMLASILTTYLVMRACGIDAGAVASAVVVIVLQIGNAVVPVPGAVGVAQVLTVETLEIWKVQEAPALAYALMLYVVTRVPRLALLPYSLSRLARQAAPHG